MKIGYISDFFAEEVLGGAELVDDIIIRRLSENFVMQKIKSDSVNLGS